MWIPSGPDSFMAHVLSRLLLPDEHVVLSVLALHGMPSNATHSADPVALRRAVGADGAVPGLTTSFHTNRVDRRKPRMWYGLCVEPLFP